MRRNRRVSRLAPDKNETHGNISQYSLSVHYTESILPAQIANVKKNYAKSKTNNRKPLHQCAKFQFVGVFVTNQCRGGY